MCTLCLKPLNKSETAAAVWRSWRVDVRALHASVPNGRKKVPNMGRHGVCQFQEVAVCQVVLGSENVACGPSSILVAGIMHYP